MEIKGQEKLISRLNGFSLETLPRALMLIGERGCGKHKLAKALAERLVLEYVELSDATSADELAEFSASPMHRLYVADLAGMSDKMQNKLLKFIEEPSEYYHVVLLAESEVGILPTVLNRCEKLRFAPFSAEALKAEYWDSIANPNDLVFEICKTPGQLLGADGDEIAKLDRLCSTIVERAKDATYANTLKLAYSINFKDDYSKFDFSLFFGALKRSALKHYEESGDEAAFRLYRYAVDAYASTLNKKINKEHFMLHFMDGLWRLAHEAV